MKKTRSRKSRDTVPLSVIFSWFFSAPVLYCTHSILSIVTCMTYCKIKVFLVGINVAAKHGPINYIDIKAKCLHLKENDLSRVFAAGVYQSL